VGGGFIVGVEFSIGGVGVVIGGREGEGGVWEGGGFIVGVEILIGEVGVMIGGRGGENINGALIVGFGETSCESGVCGDNLTWTVVVFGGIFCETGVCVGNLTSIGVIGFGGIFCEIGNLTSIGVTGICVGFNGIFCERGVSIGGLVWTGIIGSGGIYRGTGISCGLTWIGVIFLSGIYCESDVSVGGLIWVGAIAWCETITGFDEVGFLPLIFNPTSIPININKIIIKKRVIRVFYIYFPFILRMCQAES